MNHITVKHPPAGSKLWPRLIIGLLSLHVAGMVSAVILAASDGPPAVEPRFYEKAIAWNETAAQREINRSLGWTAIWSAHVGPAGSTTLRVTDASGAPVNGATCRVEVFHRAHSRDRVTSDLEFVADGVYRLPVALVNIGDHELRLSVRKGGDLFTQTSAATAYPAEPGSPALTASAKETPAP